MAKWRHFWKACTPHFHFMGEYSKHNRVKTMGTRGKVNAIWWNIKKLVSICGYELPKHLQNFTQKDLTVVKIFQKVLGELLFSETPVVHYFLPRDVMHSAYAVSRCLSVRLSIRLTVTYTTVRPSVCHIHIPILCRNNWTYNQTFFTAG